MSNHDRSEAGKSRVPGGENRPARRYKHVRRTHHASVRSQPTLPCGSNGGSFNSGQLGSVLDRSGLVGVVTSTPYLSPLRYPGGKGGLSQFLASLIERQRFRCTTYIEPFAGGAGAALRLLYDEYVETIVLNDLDPGIAAFWRSVVTHTAEFIARVQHCPITLDEWHRCKEIYTQRAGRDLELGFATFFLNRTNRSGILTARPIGGLQQTGRWKIDARFNRADLAHGLRLIGRYRNRITVSQEDGVDLVHAWLQSEAAASFCYIDPPYLNNGAELYLDTLGWQDHIRLAELLKDSQRMWMVTYDCDSRVPAVLYPDLPYARFGIAHTAAKQHVGQEYAVFSRELMLPDLTLMGSGGAVTLERS